MFNVVKGVKRGIFLENIPLWVVYKEEKGNPYFLGK
jgi:hypothetical protein